MSWLPPRLTGLILLWLWLACTLVVRDVSCARKLSELSRMLPATSRRIPAEVGSYQLLQV
jgi:hypothetical protein